jgi:hypothetical protein
VLKPTIFLKGNLAESVWERNAKPRLVRIRNPWPF